jgi:DNA-binding SARP family transcriptional activator/pimeloyl-ACP methyl ester carboxylesterase
MPVFKVRTFGFPEIDRDGVPCTVTLQKGLAALVYLTEERRPVSRDAIATLLWPEESADVVRARLRRLLHRLRGALGHGLTADRSTVQWSSSADVEVDCQLFEQACDRGEFELACHLYRGDFLEGFSLADSSMFDEWAFFRRETLRGRAMQALERVVQSKSAARDYREAARYARRLADFDPLSEVYARHLIRSLLLGGDRAAAQRAFDALRQRLRDELAIEPEAETQALLQDTAATPIHEAAPTRYAYGDGVHLAWQTYGTGPVDILLLGGFVSHVERVWEEPHCRTFLSALAGTGRLILFDRRGIGLSDRVGFAPSVDATARDIGTVLDAAGSRRAVLFGCSEGGPAVVKYAADCPDRVAGLILFASLAKGTAAPDYPHALTARQYEAWQASLVAGWGGAAGIETFAPSLARDNAARAWWAGLLRAAASPGSIKDVLSALRDADVRPLLPRISAPTLILHRRNDRAVRVEASRHIAGHIARSEMIELDGADHWPFAGDQTPVLTSITKFIDGITAEMQASPANVAAGHKTTSQERPL